MRVTVWGCRGSVATPGPDTVTYGGNTSCLEVDVDPGFALVLDAGTGIRPLGVELVRRGTRHIHLCLTHLHLDHLEGLRFFAPLWEADVTVELWGPPSPLVGLRERIARSFSPPLFPIQLRDVPAKLVFHDIPRKPWAIGRAVLAADLVLHPGATVGYRIALDGSSFAYLPDHEPALGGELSGRTIDWISGGALADSVDVLFHDSQYLDRDYNERIGWGHSSVTHAVAFARAVSARRLLLFHHEPRYSDRTLEQLEEQARELAVGDGATPPTLAREGMVVQVG